MLPEPDSVPRKAIPNRRTFALPRRQTPCARAKHVLIYRLRNRAALRTRSLETDERKAGSPATRQSDAGT